MLLQGCPAAAEALVFLAPVVRVLYVQRLLCLPRLPSSSTNLIILVPSSWGAGDAAQNPDQAPAVGREGLREKPHCPQGLPCQGPLLLQSLIFLVPREVEIVLKMAGEGWRELEVKGTRLSKPRKKGHPAWSP